jgi:hypothetical protein
VTIAAGFHCTDGIVICADTELTVGDRLKLAGEKVWRTGADDLPVAVAITGAGSVPYLRMVRDKIFGSVTKNMRLNDLRAIVEREISELHDRHLFKFPDQALRPQVALILGLRDALGHRTVLSTADTAVTDIEHYECLEAGRSSEVT